MIREQFERLRVLVERRAQLQALLDAADAELHEVAAEIAKDGPGSQAPAPSAPETPGTRPRAPGPGPNECTRAVLALMEDGVARSTTDIVRALGGKYESTRVSSVLSCRYADGSFERVSRGVYQLAKKAQRQS